jgi:hypothetical protein
MPAASTDFFGYLPLRQHMWTLLQSSGQPCSLIESHAGNGTLPSQHARQEEPFSATVQPVARFPMNLVGFWTLAVSGTPSGVDDSNTDRHAPHHMPSSANVDRHQIYTWVLTQTMIAHEPIMGPHAAATDQAASGAEWHHRAEKHCSSPSTSWTSDVQIIQGWNPSFFFSSPTQPNRCQNGERR